MFRLGFFLTLLVAVGAIRFHEWTAGLTDLHGIPIEKYVSSMNRIGEIDRLLSGITKPAARFEEIDWKNDGEHNPRENPFLYEGDIVLTEEQLDALVESHEYQLALKEGRPFDRLLTIGRPERLWSRFPIPWSVHPQGPPAGGAEMVRTALKAWEDNTCLTFRENGPVTEGSLLFYHGRGCSSPLGRTEGANHVSIGQGCGRPYIVAHEIGHSLGLFHTQTRYDRDQYLDVYKSNIQPDMKYNFDSPEPYWQATNRGVPYDLGSVMHYDRFAFANNYNIPTMLPKDRNFNYTMGQNFELAFTDAKEINMAYCNHVCSTKLSCQNGGYTDPKDCSKCRCPAGLTGTLCERVISSDPSDCGAKSILQAGPNYQSLSGSGATPATYYKIRAPAGRRIQIVLQSARFGGTGAYRACQGYFVEFKYGTQFESSGARFCDRQLSYQISMISAKNEAMVIYKSDNGYYSFQAQYKYI